MCSVVAGSGVVVALSCCVDADLLSSLVGTVACCITVWSPWLGQVLWLTGQLAVLALAVLAFVIDSVVWSPDNSVDDTWTWFWVTVFLDVCRLVLAVSGEDGECLVSLSSVAASGTLAPFGPVAGLAFVDTCLVFVADVSFFHQTFAILALADVLSVVDWKWDCSVVTLTLFLFHTGAGVVSLESSLTGA